MATTLTAATEPAASRRSRPKMLWDLSSLAFGQLISVLLGFAGFAWLARTLSPESYGLVEYVVGVTGLAAIVIEGGMGAIGTLQVSREPHRARELAASVPAARLLLALVIVPIAGFSSVAAGFDRTVTTLTWLFALSLFALPFKQDWLLQGLERMTLVAPAQALKSGVFALVVVVLVRESNDLLKIGLAEMIAAFLGAAYFLVVQHRLGVPPRLDLRFAHALSLVRTGASVGASNILWPFMVYAPVLLITNLAGGAEAAWLGGAQRIVVALVSFSALYFFNLYPLLGRCLREDREQWQRLMGSSFRLIAWASIGIALSIAVSAQAIVTTVFGAAYGPAAPVLAISVWILPLRLLSGHSRWTLLAAERQNALLFVEIACAAAIVLLCIAFIPRYGAAGAALAGVLGNVIGWRLAHVYAERSAGPMPGLRLVLIPLTGAITVAGLVWWADAPAVIEAVFAIGIYLAYMTLTAPGLVADAVRLAHAKRTVMDSGGR